MNLYPIIASMSELKENEKMLTLVVTICGILMVFVALILLIMIIGLFGKIFSAKGNSKKTKKAKAEKVAPAPKAQVASQAASAAKNTASSAPVASNSIPDEIIAVIAAAVASLDDGSYVIRSVRRSSEGRPAWSMAGIYENTRPFSF